MRRFTFGLVGISLTILSFTAALTLPQYQLMAAAILSVGLLFLLVAAIPALASSQPTPAMSSNTPATPSLMAAFYIAGQFGISPVEVAMIAEGRKPDPGGVVEAYTQQLQTIETRLDAMKLKGA